MLMSFFIYSKKIKINLRENNNEDSCLSETGS